MKITAQIQSDDANHDKQNRYYLDKFYLLTEKEYTYRRDQHGAKSRPQSIRDADINAFNSNSQRR